MRTRLFPLFILVILTFFTYVNILPNDLFFDDEELIYKNSYVADLRHFPRYFVSNMIEGAGKISNMYRPILVTSFAIDHLLWGKNPIGYHLTSILLHAANGILIYLLLNTLFGNKTISFLTAVLFIVHPVQSEAIAYGSGRTDPLSAFFGLSSLLSYLYFVKEKGSARIYWMSIIFFILGLLAKESMIVLPVLLVLCDFVSQKKPKRDLVIVNTLPFFILALVYIFLRLTILNFLNTLNFYSENNLYSTDIFIRIFTFAGVFIEYLGMIIFPKDLIIERNASVVNSPIDLRVILFIFLVMTVTFLGVGKYGKNKIYLFSLLWFFITIIPVSGIIPINKIIAEHYLYLPSLGIFLAAALFFSNLMDFESKIIRRVAIFVTVFIISALITRTIMRNFDWRDPVVFYTKSLSQSPASVPMMHNLAMTYADRGQYDQAIAEYKKIISLADVYPNTHHNLGNAYKALGRYKEAEEEYKEALKIDPNFHFSYYALVDLYKITGDKKKLDELTVFMRQRNI